MTDSKELNKLSIEFGKQGFTLKVLEITDKQLLDVLGDMGFARLNELQLAKKTEQYEKLKPEGFKYAPESVQEKWEKYKTTDNVEKLQWIHDNVSYNANHTMNILKIKKTFCINLSIHGGSFTFAKAQELEKTNDGGYKLITDYNDTDIQQKKEQTDWYKIINVFSNGNGDTEEGMKFFRDMSGCNERYWTATKSKYNKHKNDKGEKSEDLVLVRELSNYRCSRILRDTKDNYHCVCGLKDMN